ncbi:Longitudinals lacking protein, isoform G [Frankliniella fusca]|uniref:Longitudinals lacking protein, isoform G n=1 Tax=Frankliniella fusca TaxID=407009 RepID=A0AAE1H7A4_9NEOP|nr:Longitudinals lacking protein, isoform G [Frankliniella fusca]
MLLECGKEPGISCSQCDYRSPHRQNVHRHFMRKHSHIVGRNKTRGLAALTQDPLDPNAKPYTCSRCGKRYRWKRNLSRHVRVECGKAPAFLCPFCPYRSAHKTHVTRHVVCKHDNKP